MHVAVSPVRRALHKRHWARRKSALGEVYAYMVSTLGGYCGAGCDPELGCGATDNLQLHHLRGCTWTHNQVGPLKRVRLYALDFVQGRLGVLCGTCNLADGRKNKELYGTFKTFKAPF